MSLMRRSTRSVTSSGLLGKVGETLSKPVRGMWAGNFHSLAAGTAVFPNVPLRSQALLLAQLPDFGARNALVLTVIPLANVVGDLDAGFAVPGGGGAGSVAMLGPGQRVLDTEVQQLEGALGALARRDVAVMSVSGSVLGGGKAGKRRDATQC